jgi:peptidoglycan hydrolase FlgJ
MEIQPALGLAGAVPVTPSPEAAAAAHGAAQQFESFFVSNVLESMFQGLDTDPTFGGGPAEGIFRSLMLQEYGKEIARRGTLGVAVAVQREILRLQEAK